MPGIPIDLLQRQVKLVHIASQRPFTVTQSRCDASLQEASRLYNLQSCGMLKKLIFYWLNYRAVQFSRALQVDAENVLKYSR